MSHETEWKMVNWYNIELTRQTSDDVPGTRLLYFVASTTTTRAKTQSEHILLPISKFSSIHKCYKINFKLHDDPVLLIFASKQTNSAEDASNCKCQAVHNKINSNRLMAAE